MTNEHNAQDRRLEDRLYVDALLAEAGCVTGSADDDVLRDALLRLRSFRTTEVPVPCAEVVALMEGSATPLAEVVPLAGRDRKQTRGKRAVLTSLAVAASLGIAGGAAAGNETVRRHAAETIDTIVRSFAPPAVAPAQPPVPAATDPAVPTLDAPAQPAEAPGRASGVVPSPAAQPAKRFAADDAKDAVESPGRAGSFAGDRKAAPAETEQAPARAVPPSSAGEQADGARNAAVSTPPAAPEEHGAPPMEPAELATDVPAPKVSRGTSPR